MASFVDASMVVSLGIGECGIEGMPMVIKNVWTQAKVVGSIQ